MWERVQTLLQRNGRSGGAEVRNKFGALLKGLHRSVPCDSAMTPTHATRDGTRRYVCCHAKQRGWQNCAFPSIPATEIERFVVDQIRAIGRAIDLIGATVAQAPARFDPVWNSLTPREQARVVELLVERVDYDGARGKVAVTFHPDGIRDFGERFTNAEDAA